MCSSDLGLPEASAIQEESEDNMKAAKRKEDVFNTMYIQMAGKILEAAETFIDLASPSTTRHGATMSFKLDPATAISDPHGISWGMHPITWRNDDIPEVGAFNTLEDMLLDLADVGFRGTECAGFFPPKEVVKEFPVR